MSNKAITGKTRQLATRWPIATFAALEARAQSRGVGVGQEIVSIVEAFIAARPTTARPAPVGSLLKDKS